MPGLPHHPPTLDPASSPPSLESIWSTPSPQICAHCHLPITSGALIRTFRILPLPILSPSRTGTALLPLSPTHNLLLITRHFPCLLSGKALYLTISHVWDPLISQTQNLGPSILLLDPARAKLAAEQAFSEALQVHEGIRRAFDSDFSFEVWHDYLSVPQWDHGAKREILLKIPELYHRSLFTVVVWKDVSPEGVRELFADEKGDGDGDGDGEDGGRRLKAITHICNAAWFRRVWTTMEYFRSRRVRVMLSDFELVGGSGQEDGSGEGVGDDLFLSRINSAWLEEGRKLGGNVYELESRAGLHYNLLPWQIGDLHRHRMVGPEASELERSRARASGDFGSVFERVAIRGCSNRMDFYFAILGLLGMEGDRAEKIPALRDGDAENAHRGIILASLMHQDYSPLLMVPLKEVDCSARFFHGFHDIRSWGLGLRTSSAVHALVVEITEDGGKARFKAQCTGEVTFFEPGLFMRYGRDPVPIFAQVASIVLRFTGPDIEKFIVALGMRMFACNPHAVIRRLKKLNRYKTLRNTLVALYESGNELITWTEEVVSKMIGDLGFADMDLNNYQAETEDYLRQPRYVMDAESKQWTPMTEFMMYYTDLHMEELATYIGMQCPGCGEMILTRAGLYHPPAELFQSDDGETPVVGFRIPGLQYQRTVPDGVGILVKDGRIVGRFLFCAPCCTSVKSSEIQVGVPDIPMPTPNPYEYGQKHEWKLG